MAEGCHGSLERKQPGSRTDPPGSGPGRGRQGLPAARLMEEGAGVDWGRGPGMIGEVSGSFGLCEMEQIQQGKGVREGGRGEGGAAVRGQLCNHSVV